MVGSVDFHAWLNLKSQGEQVIIVPYISAPRDSVLRYELKLMTSSSTGTSNIAQSGTLTLQSQRPHPISSLRVTRHPDGQCTLRLILKENDEEVGTYDLDCYKAN